MPPAGQAGHGFNECLRLDYRTSGIRVTEILPGVVRTDFAQRRWEAAATADAFCGGFDTLLRAEDVARAMLYALEQPPHVVVSQLLIVPTSQD